MSALNWSKDKARRQGAESARAEYASNEHYASAPPEHRIWLNVPYAHKEEAKRAGCRWDPGVKRWYAALCTEQSKIKRWM